MARAGCCCKRSCVLWIALLRRSVRASAFRRGEGTCACGQGEGGGANRAVLRPPARCPSFALGAARAGGGRPGKERSGAGFAQIEAPTAAELPRFPPGKAALQEGCGERSRGAGPAARGGAGGQRGAGRPCPSPSPAAVRAGPAQPGLRRSAPGAGGERGRRARGALPSYSAANPAAPAAARLPSGAGRRPERGARHGAAGAERRGGAGPGG